MRGGNLSYYFWVSINLAYSVLGAVRGTKFEAKPRRLLHLHLLFSKMAASQFNARIVKIIHYSSLKTLISNTQRLTAPFPNK